MYNHQIATMRRKKIVNSIKDCIMGNNLNPFFSLAIRVYNCHKEPIRTIDPRFDHKRSLEIYSK